MSALAIFGGTKLRDRPFPAYRVMGPAEADAAKRVVESGVLSKFLGTWHEDFWGGPEVRAFEAAWATEYDAAHALSVNSATSGLYAAVGAAGVGPGDEVVVSPYTMSASAAAALVFNAVPIFADINPETYCLSADTIAAKITPRTRAIVVVHIFGQVVDMDPIMALARERNLVVIEDCAQSPSCTYKGRPVGTLGHIGVFSLNYHKHIHTGEGGVVTTNDAKFADRVALIRNHAEAVVAGKGTTDLVNMIGFNFRLGEIEAAIGRLQLAKSRPLVEARRANVAYLESRLKGLEGLRMPAVAPGASHAYYVHALSYDPRVTGVSRDLVVRALKAELPPTELREAEGPLIGQGYVKPLYLQPLYQKMIGYGLVQCPFKCPHYCGSPDYALGACPDAEKAHFETLITHELMRPGMTRADLDDVAGAFEKVWRGLPELRASEGRNAR
ncbi:MAG: DegT/DnrJ/EryC1/StrS family aminotransferase [Azospirillum sp.]|nr:DegT/DnrJ/EryC1/StrS family aminotransferase [Azospirillum sp.]